MPYQFEASTSPLPLLPAFELLKIGSFIFLPPPPPTPSGKKLHSDVLLKHNICIEQLFVLSMNVVEFSKGWY